MIDQKLDVWEWIVKNLNNAIDRPKNGNPIIRKFIRIHPHEDNPNIGLSDKYQELLDKLKNIRLYGEGEIKISTSTSKSKRIVYELSATCCINTSSQHRSIPVPEHLRQDTT
jgi:hypothetical protein